MNFRFGFLLKNCVYSRLETFGNPQFGQKVAKFSFGEGKKINPISGLEMPWPVLTIFGDITAIKALYFLT